MATELDILLEMRRRLDRYRAGLMKRIKAAREAERARIKAERKAAISPARAAQLEQWDSARTLKRAIACAYLNGQRRADVKAHLGLSTRNIERLLDEGIKWLARDVIEKVRQRDGTPAGRWTRAMDRAKKPERTAELDRSWRARRPAELFSIEYGGDGKERARHYRTPRAEP